MSRNFSIIVAIAAVLSACSPPQQQQMTPMAGFMVVKEQPVQLTAELPGRTDPTAVSDVRPQVNGIIKARLFVEGSTVKVGQPLYQIDPAPYQAAYDSAAATFPAPRSRPSRYAELLKASAIAPQDNDDAQAAYLLAKANVETARINLDYTRIVAPIAGRIGASTVTVGALVTANQADVAGHHLDPRSDLCRHRPVLVRIAGAGAFGAERPDRPRRPADRRSDADAR